MVRYFPTRIRQAWSVLAIVTAGLSLIPATTAPANTLVQIIAIPPTQ